MCIVGVFLAFYIRNSCLTYLWHAVEVQQQDRRVFLPHLVSEIVKSKKKNTFERKVFIKSPNSFQFVDV